MRKMSYALLVGAGNNYALPLIEIHSFSLLREQVLKDCVDTILTTGSPAWWFPSGNLCTGSIQKDSADCKLLWPSFGRVISLAEAFCISIIQYPKGADSIDLTKSVGHIYVGWVENFGWCVNDRTDGGWFFEPGCMLPSTGTIGKVLALKPMGNNALLDKTWLTKEQRSFRTRVNPNGDKVSYNAQTFLDWPLKAYDFS